MAKTNWLLESWGSNEASAAAMANPDPTFTIAIERAGLPGFKITGGANALFEPGNPAR